MVQVYKKQKEKKQKKCAGQHKWELECSVKESQRDLPFTSLQLSNDQVATQNGLLDAQSALEGRVLSSIRLKKACSTFSLLHSARGAEC